VTSLAERYFRPKPFELDGRLYAWLGVVRFKRVLTSLFQVDPERPVTNGYVLGGRSLEHVRAFERISRRSELIHLAGLLLAGLFLVFSLLWGGLLLAGLFVFAVNFHCFLLQRYNRSRVYRVLERAQSLRPERRPSSR
jgi:hypothetical protein